MNQSDKPADTLANTLANKASSGKTFSGKTVIDLLRHGEPQGGEMFRGHTDLPLSELGWQQMHGAVKTQSNPPWQRIITSPLLRCQAFARQVSDVHAIPVLEEDAMREISFGDWDGVSFDQVKRDHAELFSRYWTDVEKYTPPNGEPMTDFHQRVTASWHAIVDRHTGEHLLLVAHGGVIRVLLAEVLQMPLNAITRLNVPYACLTRVNIYHKQGYQPWAQLEFHQGRLD